MEGKQVHCGVCGEEVKSVAFNLENGETSSILQSYLKGISRHFREEINIKGLTACDSCRLKINSLQIRKEWFEGLSKEVSEAERNLHRKLTDMESVGQQLLHESDEIEKLMKDRIQKDLNLGQREVFLKKGTEKATVALKETLKELKEKQNYVGKWTGEIDAGSGARASSSSDQVACKILSVTSQAVIEKEMEGLGFEAGEVFQEKTEQEQSDGEEADMLFTGEPIPDCVVKVEEDEIRTTRHRVIYGNRKVRVVPFEALPNTKLQTASNQEGQATEFDVIDLEIEEGEALNELPGLREETVAGDSTEGCEKGTLIAANLTKRSIMEVNRDEREVQVEQTRQKVSRWHVSPGNHRKGAIVEESLNSFGSEHPSHAATALIPFTQVKGTSQDEAAQDSSIAGATEQKMIENVGEKDEIENEENDTMSEKGKADNVSLCEAVDRDQIEVQVEESCENFLYHDVIPGNLQHTSFKRLMEEETQFSRVENAPSFPSPNLVEIPATKSNSTLNSTSDYGSFGIKESRTPETVEDEVEDKEIEHLQDVYLQGSNMGYPLPKIARMEETGEKVPTRNAIVPSEIVDEPVSSEMLQLQALPIRSLRPRRAKELSSFSILPSSKEEKSDNDYEFRDLTQEDFGEGKMYCKPLNTHLKEFTWWTNTGLQIIPPRSNQYVDIKVSSSEEATVVRKYIKHTDSNILKCHYCYPTPDNAYVHLNRYKEHLATHLGAAMFQCDSCLRRFMRKRGKAHHRCTKETGESTEADAPFKCYRSSHKMPYETHRSDTFRRHMQCMHRLIWSGANTSHSRIQKDGDPPEII